jgi:hypothetical protein
MLKKATTTKDSANRLSRRIEIIFFMIGPLIYLD